MNAVFLSASFQYNIKKKEEVVEQQPQEEPNPLMRKKKTPEELAAEAEQEDLDDFTSKFPAAIRPTPSIFITISSRFLCSSACRAEEHDRKPSKWNKDAAGKQMCYAVIR